MTEMRRVALVGAHGRLGQRLEALAADHGFEVVRRVGRDGLLLAAEAVGVDLVIDFSAPAQTVASLAFAAERSIPCVLGTTGLGAAELQSLAEAAEVIPVVFTPNFSVGVTLLTHLVTEVSRRLPETWELEIVESHHRAKVDAPSGTALALARAGAEARGWGLEEVIRTGRAGAAGPRAPREIGVHAVRGGSVVGSHDAIFLAAGETLTLAHAALDRDIFARGALRSGRWLLGLDGGERPRPGVHDMNSVLGLR